MKSAVSMILAGILFCSTGFSSPIPTPKIPQDWKDFHFSSDPALSVIDKKAILAAELSTLKKHISKKLRDGTIYRVTKVKNGYSVQCESYSTDEKGDMHFVPGGFCVVTLDKNFKVLNTMGGV